MYSQTNYKNNALGKTKVTLPGRENGILGDGVVPDASGKYVLDVANVPASPDEDYMPPLATVMQHVTFYYTPYTSSEEFWKKEGEHWSKEITGSPWEKASMIWRPALSR